VPTIDTGSASAGMIVADARRTNRKMTMTTRITVRPRVCCTSETAALIGAARSLSTLISTAPGSSARKTGINALI
jgi:hypothetical protein